VSADRSGSEQKKRGASVKSSIESRKSLGPAHPVIDLVLGGVVVAAPSGRLRFGCRCHGGRSSSLSSALFLCESPWMLANITLFVTVLSRGVAGSARHPIVTLCRSFFGQHGEHSTTNVKADPISPHPRSADEFGISAIAAAVWLAVPLNHPVIPVASIVRIEQNLSANHAALVDVECCRTLGAYALKCGHLINLELPIAVGIARHLGILALELLKRCAKRHTAQLRWGMRRRCEGGA